MRCANMIWISIVIKFSLMTLPVIVDLTQKISRLYRVLIKVPVWLWLYLVWWRRRTRTHLEPRLAMCVGCCILLPPPRMRPSTCSSTTSSSVPWDMWCVFWPYLTRYYNSSVSHHFVPLPEVMDYLYNNLCVCFWTRRYQCYLFWIFYRVGRRRGF